MVSPLHLVNVYLILFVFSLLKNTVAGAPGKYEPETSPFSTINLLVVCCSISTSKVISNVLTVKVVSGDDKSVTVVNEFSSKLYHL